MKTIPGRSRRGNKAEIAHQNIHEQTKRLSIQSWQRPALSMKLDFKSSLLIEQYWMGFSKGFMGWRDKGRLGDNDNLCLGWLETQLIVC